MTARPEVEGRVAPDLDDVEWVEVGRLEPFEGNPRTISDAERGRLARSLRRFGFREPLVVRREDGLVVGGHQRLDVALELGYDEVPVAWVEGLSDEDAAALNVALNNPQAQGDWDERRLAELVASLDGSDVDVAATGFSDGKVEQLLDLADPGGVEGDDYEPEPPPEPDSEPGELYELGEHRLICGDATEPDVLGRLVDDREVEMIWTDPPYGVDYEGRTERKLTIRNDEAQDTFALLVDAFRHMGGQVVESCPFYVAAPAGPQGTVFRLALDEAGWQFHQALVWVKDTMVLGHSDYHYRHEDVLYGWMPGPGRAGRGDHEGSRWYGGNDATTIFEVERPKASRDHPTMKPPALIGEHLKNSSRRGSWILDPFAGSGSTMVACEQAGRKAMMVEIDPRYCDVIRERCARLVDDSTIAPS